MSGDVTMRKNDGTAKPLPGDGTVIPSTSDRVAYKRNMEEIDRLVVSSRYPYIVAWGKWLGFTPEVVLKYVTLAESENAPEDSIQKTEGKWVRIGDVVNDTNRNRVEGLVNVSARSSESRRR
jgi:hypothetical protein